MRRADTLTARLVLGLRRPRRRFQVMGIEVAGEVDERCMVKRRSRELVPPYRTRDASLSIEFA